MLCLLDLIGALLRHRDSAEKQQPHRRWSQRKTAVASDEVLAKMNSN